MKVDPERHGRDRDLVHEALGSSGAAMDRLLERLECVPRILAVMNARAGGTLDASELSDVVQDTLIALWKKLPSFEGHSTLETWAYRFCAFEIQNAARRKRRAGARVGELAADDVATSPEDTRAESDAPFARESLREALAHVPPHEREILEWKHFRGLTFEEMARQLGISPNTAKTRYYRGLERLRRILESRDESLER